MQTATSTPSPSHIETEVQRIRALLESSQFAPALAAAEVLLTEVPENRDVLYMTAIALRYLQRIPEALAILDKLERIYPYYPRLYQERGYCYSALRSVEPAIKAFEQAIKMSPALSTSWQILHALYQAAGQIAAASHASAQITSLAKLPPEIVTAYTMYADNDLYDADRLLRQYLRTHGPQAEGMRLLAQIGVRMDATDEAELLLKEVVKLAPEYDAARYDYAAVLLRRHKHAQAREELEQLLQKDSGNPIYRALLAAIYSGFDHQQAVPIYQQLLNETPHDAELHVSVGHAYKALGRVPEAVAAYRTATDARTDYGDAYWSLANLKTYRFSEMEIARMQKSEASPSIRLEDQYHLCFALGKAFEDSGAYAESFAYYERGNTLKKSEGQYRPEMLERNVRLQATICNQQFFATRRGFGSPDKSPIFIVGLPRSGSTLLEQILASHSQVEGTMELPHVPRLTQDLWRRTGQDSISRYPGVLTELNADECTLLGEEYLADTRLYRTGKSFFIDKMPNNFRHIGLIHLMLPNAKIIDARRNALPCCFSNYQQLFASGQHFAYSVEDITRYYRMYIDLMAHWDRVLPGKILHVQYEEVVEDLESNVRRILEFCGLQFEPACLDFHNTERRIHTASSEQVRRPINRDGIERWHHFDPWLGPFKTALSELSL